MEVWEKESVVLFDGVCNLCNTVVNVLIRMDTDKRLKFASLQSQVGQQILRRFKMNPTELNTFVFYAEGKVYTRSRAALEVLRTMGKVWKMCFYIGLLVPSCLRDRLYAWIAANRYRWFGKSPQCRLPSPELKTRFLL
ncbi:MAG: DCC1-like thiol-disulfide oxidoreductase family protein [Cytophagales bacterium]|nr:DCC1-like thiol-disulfide oxidoreductase family protein [Bernardetiaceae bacterium]MDW8210052.1 DCC1-like thiol-disulfide oxidoreductase family protein [Cytophagales bacterium]